MIKVGGSSEIEVKERKDRVDDALHATRAAVEEGIVPGGGTALLYATKALEGLKGANDDQTRGIDIVRKALQSPVRQIAENAGHDGAVVAGKLLDGKDETMGFNAQTEVYENLVKAGVIDPTKVVRTALQDAASVAGLLITTEAAVSELPEDKPAMPAWAAAAWAAWAAWTSEATAGRGVRPKAARTRPTPARVSPAPSQKSEKEKGPGGKSAGPFLMPGPSREAPSIPPGFPGRLRGPSRRSLRVGVGLRRILLGGDVGFVGDHANRRGGRDCSRRASRRHCRARALPRR